MFYRLNPILQGYIFLGYEKSFFKTSKFVLSNEQKAIYLLNILSKEHMLRMVCYLYAEGSHKIIQNKR